MCPKNGILDELSGLFGGQTQADRDNEAVRRNAEIAAKNAREMNDKSNEALLRAQELANQGMLEAAGMAVEESRAAREASLQYIKESTAKAQSYLDATLGQTEPTIRKAQSDALAILDEFGEKSADLYRPYIGAGTEALAATKKMAEEGVQVPTDLTKSPYYPLYQFQQEQQKKAIDQNLSARGLYDSGKGITEQVQADTGLTQSFTAEEYQRAVDDFNRKAGIEGSLLQTGYGAAGNLASIYGALGANKAGVVQWGGGTLANLQAQTGLAKANAAIGAGTSSSGISMNAGNQLANIYNQLGINTANTALATGQGQATSADRAGTNLSNIYINSGATQAYLLNQQAQNRTNMFSGLVRGGAGALNSYFNTRRTTQPTTTPTTNYTTLPNDTYDQWSGGDWGEGSGTPDYDWSGGSYYD